MKRRHKRRRNYKRRSSLSSSNWGPVLALLATVLGVAGVAALVVFVALPKILPLVGIDYLAPFAETPTPAPTPAPTPTPNPMDSFVAAEAQKEVVFESSSSLRYFADPYFYNGKMILSAGQIVDGKAILGEAYFYEPETRTAEKIDLSLANTHVMFPKFNDDWIVYLDASMSGGGYIEAIDRGDPSSPIIIKEVYTGQPEPMLDGKYLAWTERTGTRMDKLFVCDLETRETTTLHMFSNNPYGQSLPYLRDGRLVWADVQSSGSGDGEDVSVIYSMKLGSPAVDTFTPGGYVHDPQSDGRYTAWLDANHSLECGLWLSENKGEPVLIDSGVVQFGLGNGFLAYSKDEIISVYRFDNAKTYRISAEYEHAQLLGVSDGKVIWMDVTSRDRDILKFAELP